MEITVDDPPAIQQVKCNISQEIKRRWHLDELDVINPGSNLIATCLDPRSRQTKFLNSHNCIDLQSRISYLADQATSSSPASDRVQESEDSTVTVQSQNALDILL